MAEAAAVSADGVDMTALSSGNSGSGGFDLQTYLSSLTAAGLDAASAAQLAAVALENMHGPQVQQMSRLPDGSRFIKRPKHELPCRLYMRGNRQGFCRYGDTCQYSHDPELIQHALSLGPIEPWVRSKDIACRFHAAGPGRCHKGEECQFSHDADVISKAIARGEVVLFMPRDKAMPPNPAAAAAFLDPETMEPMTQ